MASSESELLIADPLALRVCAAAHDAGRAVSAYELGQVLEKAQASLTRPLEKLSSAGALRPGTVFRRGRSVAVFDFNPAWKGALADALRRASVGQLGRAQKLILVTSDGIEPAARLLQRGSFLEQVAWISEFEDSRLGLAIALSDDFEASALAGVIPALRRLGLPQDGAIRVVVGRTLDRADVPTWTHDVLDGVSLERLPAG
jgi:hypothetical protein